MVDAIKAVKSEEELALIRRTAAMQDAAMDTVFKAIKPGMRDIEAAAIAELLGGARLAVLPSREESFGNAMAEAMATGTPLITTCAGSVPEVVGDAAVLIESGDVRGLREAMHALLSNEPRARELGLRGRDRVAREFSWRATAKRFVDIYEAMFMDLR